MEKLSNLAKPQPSVILHKGIYHIHPTGLEQKEEFRKQLKSSLRSMSVSQLHRYSKGDTFQEQILEQLVA
jgi:hypothetical protein